MRKLIAVFLLCSFAAVAQSKPATSNTTKKPAAKPSAAAAAKPAAKPAATARPKAIIETSMGNINCTLFPDKAPLTVENFIGFATGTKDWTNPASKAKKHGVPLYDGLTFHRVIPGFMIQTGDPMGNGQGGPGFDFKDEISDLRFDQPGRLAMANSGPNTNGSQFFITEVPTQHLNGKHTIFGQCENLDIVKKIANVPTGMNDKPLKPVMLKKIVIVKPGAAAPAAKKPATTTGKTPAKK